MGHPVKSTQMFQNCIGEDLTCRVRAAVDIAKGSEVTTTYTHGLAGTAWRRRHLREEWEETDSS